MKKLTIVFSCLFLYVSGLLAQNKFGEFWKTLDFYGTIGYGNKDWVTDFPQDTKHENFWGERNRRLHGMKFELGGAHPLSDFGLAFQFGLGLEFYFSAADDVKDRGWDTFNEFSLYFPLHIAWDLPISTQNVKIQPFAGMGFNCAVVGEYQLNNDPYLYNSDGDYIGPHEHQRYGHGEYPRRWNNQFEYGCNVFFKQVMLGFTYSHGLTDHKLYDFYKTKQNKMAINIGYFFSH